MKLDVVQADITTLAVDAIVNAANASLRGGGGVDGAIHRAAGPGLLAECRTLGGCVTGEAKATAGYRLPARHVIHVAGPVWRGGGAGEAELLAACYRNALRVARALDLRSIAFPAISTGIYGYPLEAATAIAVDSVLAWGPEAVSTLLFCCFSAGDAEVYRSILAQRGWRAPASGLPDPRRTPQERDR